MVTETHYKTWQSWHIAVVNTDPCKCCSRMEYWEKYVNTDKKKCKTWFKYIDISMGKHDLQFHVRDHKHSFLGGLTCLPERVVMTLFFLVTEHMSASHFLKANFFMINLRKCDSFWRWYLLPSKRLCTYFIRNIMWVIREVFCSTFIKICTLVEVMEFIPHFPSIA